MSTDGKRTSKPTYRKKAAKVPDTPQDPAFSDVLQQSVKVVSKSKNSSDRRERYRQEKQSEPEPPLIRHESSGSTRPVCRICCESARYESFGKCDHVICSRCMLRLRSKHSDYQCVFCKGQLDVAIVVDLKVNGVYSEAPTFASLNLESMDLDAIETRTRFDIDDACKMLYTCHDHFRDMMRLKSVHCPHCNLLMATNKLLCAHYTSCCSRFLCLHCLDNRSLFVSEQETFSNDSALQQHCHDAHVTCEFCPGKHFYDSSKLHEHLTQDHITCPFCSQNRYFKQPSSLFKHFVDAHYVCKLCKMSEQAIFSLDSDLVSHMNIFHGFGLDQARKSVSGSNKITGFSNNHEDINESFVMANPTARESITVIDSFPQLPIQSDDDCVRDEFEIERARGSEFRLNRLRQEKLKRERIEDQLKSDEETRQALRMEKYRQLFVDNKEAEDACLAEINRPLYPVDLLEWTCKNMEYICHLEREIKELIISSISSADSRQSNNLGVNCRSTVDANERRLMHIMGSFYNLNTLSFESEAATGSGRRKNNRFGNQNQNVKKKYVRLSVAWDPSDDNHCLSHLPSVALSDAASRYDREIGGRTQSLLLALRRISGEEKIVIHQKTELPEENVITDDVHEEESNDDDIDGWTTASSVSSKKKARKPQVSKTSVLAASVETNSLVADEALSRYILSLPSDIKEDILDGSASIIIFNISENGLTAGDVANGLMKLSSGLSVKLARIVAHSAVRVDLRSFNDACRLDTLLKTYNELNDKNSRRLMLESSNSVVDDDDELIWPSDLTRRISYMFTFDMDKYKNTGNPKFQLNYGEAQPDETNIEVINSQTQVRTQEVISTQAMPKVRKSAFAPGFLTKRSLPMVDGVNISPEGQAEMIREEKAREAKVAAKARDSRQRKQDIVQKRQAVTHAQQYGNVYNALDEF